MKIEHLQVNHRNTPIVESPIEFSYRIISEDRDVLQKSYRIEIFDGSKKVYDSGVVISRDQSFIRCSLNLESRKRYTYKITVEDNFGNIASEESYFETALLTQDDWKGCFIESPFDRNDVPYFTYGVENPVLEVLKSFKSKSVKKAMLYITSYGAYKAFINGETISETQLAPEFTPYDKLLNYQCYDVTSFIKNGDNELSVLLGDGWYFCNQTAVLTSNRHDKPSLLFQLELESDDGNVIVTSSGDEMIRKTNILFSDLFMGEKVDLTKKCTSYVPVVKKDYDKSIIHVQMMDQIQEVETFKPVSILHSPKGETIIDFGQVISGFTRVKIKEERGRVISLEHVEVLDKDGNWMYCCPAMQRDVIITDGREFIYQPTFTFHGFRYLKVEGMDDVSVDRFEAVLLSTPKENLSSFTCSDERFNRLYQNIRYSQKNNMMSIPTDCPTREKAGWSGDISLYSTTALKNENMTPFLTSWLKGLALDTTKSGVVPIVSPYTNMYDITARSVMKACLEDKKIDVVDNLKGETNKEKAFEITNVAGWSDAIINIPYNMYKIDGNKMILEENFSIIKRFIDEIINVSKTRRGTSLDDELEAYLWDTGFHFGEWLIPGYDSNGFEDCKLSSLYISAFYGYIDVFIMSEICSILKKEEERKYYSSIASKMKNAIQRGLIANDLLPHCFQGVYVLAIAFDLVDDKHFEEYKERLISLIEEHDYKVQTGFLATPYLFAALDKIGRRDIAKKILFQDEDLSWLYEVKRGATTIWENWHSYLDDGNPKRTSFDHYAYGVIDDVIMESICGIQNASVGFQDIIINPDMNYGFTHLERSYISQAGLIKMECDIDHLKVIIPPNCTAKVIWKGKEYAVGSGIYTF